MSSPTVTVRGSVTLEADPEIARLIISVQAQEPDRTRALSAVAAGTATVKALLAQAGDAVETTDTRAVQVRPQFDADGRKRRISGYLSVVTMTATVVDFGVLGDLALRLGDTDLVSLDGPFWALRTDSPLYRQARIDAVKDARVRASEYAEAAGGVLTGLLSISDEDVADHNMYAGRSVPGFAGARASNVADTVTLDLTPSRQTVHGAVEARFTMSNPDFSARL